MKDEPLAKCPKCGRKSLKRLLGGGAGLIFKGTGFYATDYKKTSGKKPEANEKPAKPAGNGAGREGTSKSAAAPAPSATN